MAAGKCPNIYHCHYCRCELLFLQGERLPCFILVFKRQGLAWGNGIFWGFSKNVINGNVLHLVLSCCCSHEIILSLKVLLNLLWGFLKEKKCLFEYCEKYMHEFLHTEGDFCALGGFWFVLGLFPALAGAMLMGKASGIKLPSGYPASWNSHPHLYLFYNIKYSWKKRNDGRSSALFMLGFVIPLYYKLHKLYYWSQQTCLETEQILHFQMAKRLNLGHFKAGFLSCESVNGDNLMSDF